MATGDTPTIVPYAHTHSTYTGAQALGYVEPSSTVGVALEAWGGGGGGGGLGSAFGRLTAGGGGYQNQLVALGLHGQRAAIEEQHQNLNSQLKNQEPAMSRRVVQVYIADPDERVPLEQSLLYSGQQKLTDATDQELFFEIEIKSILDAHNEKRVKIVNKKVKGDRTEYLEPVKIRDLKMVVVNVATF